MARSMMRCVAAVAILAIGMHLQGCSKGFMDPWSPYQVKKTKVYSNSKYLADFHHGMSLDTCKEHCSNWKTVCPDLCSKDKMCALSDSVDARHFTREESCALECVGFNMHSDGHCTLFAENVKLIEGEGGRGTFYLMIRKKMGQKIKPPKAEDKAPEKKEKKSGSDDGGSYGSDSNNNNNNNNYASGSNNDNNNYASGNNDNNNNYASGNNNNYASDSNNNNYASNSNNNNNYAANSNNNNYASNNNNNNNYASNSNNNNYASNSNNNNNYASNSNNNNNNYASDSNNNNNYE